MTNDPLARDMRSYGLSKDKEKGEQAMSSSIMYSLASGMLQEMNQYDLIAQNIAGSSIPAYKREYYMSESFSDTLSDVIGSEKSQHLNGAVQGQKIIDFTQGALKPTPRALDFAIMGDNAFFEVKNASGQTMYTRNGAFYVNKDGMLVTSEGYEVTSSSGRFKFNKDDNLERVQVCEDGSLRIIDEKTNENVVEMGKLKITKVEEPQKLMRVTGSYYMLNPAAKTAMSDAKVEDYNVVNHNLEVSNFSPVQQMTQMIESLRKFEMGQRMLKARDETMKSEVQKILG